MADTEEFYRPEPKAQAVEYTTQELRERADLVGKIVRGLRTIAENSPPSSELERLDVMTSTIVSSLKAIEESAPTIGRLDDLLQKTSSVADNVEKAG